MKLALASFATNSRRKWERLAAGLAIGSGQMEGTSLKQTGAKRRRERVDQMGIICSICYGEQWNDYGKTAR